MLKPITLCLALALGIALASCQQDITTRGIGVYPGRETEYTGPKVVPGDAGYRNIALFRIATHSSSSDVDHTAQLLTDGVVADSIVCSWKSLGASEEWVSIDLGAVSSFDRMVFRWLNPPTTGKVQTSKDSKRWKDVAAIGADEEISLRGKGRYVRALLDASANGEPFELAEWEIYGKGGVKTAPGASPEREGNRQNLAGGSWKLRRCLEVDACGEVLSLPGFDDAVWMDATVPGTVLASYVNAGAVPDPNHADNQLFISDEYFKADFWYRKSFEAHPDTPRQFLHFSGINFRADIYLNGRLADHIDGAFREKDIDVSGLLAEGTNCLAVKIIHNDNYGDVKVQDAYFPGPNGGVLGADNPTMHATIGWDWIPTVRGRSIGIYDDVYIKYTGPVTVEDPFVRTELPLPDTTSAQLFAEATLVNHSDAIVRGVLNWRFGDISFKTEETIAAGERKTVRWDPLTLNNPKLWWPKGYGEQNLYDVSFSFESAGAVSDACSFKTGVRQMDFNLYPYTPVSQCWMRGKDNNQRLDIFVNGRRFIGFGGNWGFPEHLLNYRDREYDVAVGYHADMNFTMIRDWVGMTSSRSFYEACDRYGVMIWQDFWLANPADGPNPADPERFKDTAEEYVRLIRNHPSIGIYVGRNEGYPPEDIDEFLDEMVAREHPGLFYISHSGADGVSGGGPYQAYPVKDYFRMFGADKLHSERGMPNVMNYENLLRTMGEDDIEPVSTEAHPNDMYGLHDWCLGSKQGFCAQRIESFNKLIAKAFGEPADAKEFAELAQWVNYDGYRAIFEGRSEHRRGLQLWMSHPAWPSMVWQTYDYYLEPTAAYFGCKKACEPIHILFNPIHGNVEVANYHAGERSGLNASAVILDINGKPVWEKSCPLDIAEDETAVCFPLEVPGDITDVYFVRLKLSDSQGVILSDNFYWQGKEEGNLTALRSLPKARVAMKVSREQGAKECVMTAKLTNKSKTPALMLRLKVEDGDTGDLVLPVWYSDNYIFLMPGESRTVTARVRREDCHGTPRLQLQGFNLYSTPEIRNTIVFAEGSDSCHFYRIPAMCLDARGNVVAVIDRRYENLADLGYRRTSIDIACKRSTDGGRTWGPQSFIARGDTSRVLGYGYGDASLTCLPSGRIVCLFACGNGTKGFRRGLKHTTVCTSDDGGITWSEPRLVAFPDTLHSAFVTSGKGIVDADGDILLAADVLPRDYPDPMPVPWPIEPHLFYSKDGGESWTLQPEPLFSPADETKLVLLPDGRLLSSSRRWFYGPRGLNTAVKGPDGIWHWEGERFTEGLVANPCNGDIVLWRDGLLLHSYIKEEKARRGLTLAVSADNGTSWKDVLTLQPGPAAYSTMVVFRNGDVGVLYEDGSRSTDDGYDIVFSRIPRKLLKKACKI